MSHYKSNLRDIFFNVFEAIRVQDYLDTAPFGGIDEATAGDILREVDRFSREEFAVGFTDDDRDPPRLVDGTVTLPDGLKRSLGAFHDAGWHAFPLPEELGGSNPPAVLRWGAQELFVGANPAAYLTVGGSLMAAVLNAVGTPEQIETWAHRVIDEPWGGTMVLTEPDAGSDVGAGVTKAVHVDGEVYHLTGVKRFISSGDGDFFDNIVHLVLARPEGAGPGTKGLSMFIVPKYLLNDDGSPRERNGVETTAIEDKMGIKASVTAELTLGRERPAVGYLVGGAHDGIAQMFKVIEEARMLIGAKAMATLSTGYLHALEFATERIQGPDLTTATDKASPRVAIIRHPDVRRMLMEQKAMAEGLRALLHHAAWAQDRARIEPEEPYWAGLADLLLPLVKGYSSERGYELLAQSLQVLGGSGFTKDYPIEQYIRDAKIDTLYEGTTGIQALDLFFRKIVKDQGATLTRLGGEILATVKGGGDDDSLSSEREALGVALDDVQAHVGSLVGHAMASRQAPPEIYKVGLHANHLLWSLSEVVIGWLLIRHAEIAHRSLEEAGPDRAFYEGKIASARFFARTVLPQTAQRRRLAETEDGALMELPDEAF